MVMALGKGRGKKGSKKCCAACSVGKECLKFESKEDGVELMVAPCRRWGDNQEEESAISSPSASPLGEGARGFSPVSGRTRGRTGRVAEPAPLQAPLREAVGNTGPVTVKTPFSITDLMSWKEVAGLFARLN